jgi:hypothetical protein
MIQNFQVGNVLQVVPREDLENKNPVPQTPPKPFTQAGVSGQVMQVT